ncbi:MAG: TIM barrel protein [Bacillota bacterium]|nr:TIM barrel protein [Bacillota bacterium]
MIRSGLVSITFRHLDAAAVIAVARRARLSGIEWGGDVHVPHGDTERAKTIRAMTEDAGLTVASYGSYYRAGEAPSIKNPDFADVLTSAKALGAPVIRVWAGNQPSNKASAVYQKVVIDDSARIARMAESENIRIAFEYHMNTLTDTSDSAVNLLNQAGHPNLFCYWQPPSDMDTATAQEGLQAISSWLSHIHVFYWPRAQERRPLSEGSVQWRSYFDLIKSVPGDRYAMLEFVLHDNPDQAVSDAMTLNRLLDD